MTASAIPPDQATRRTFRKTSAASTIAHSTAAPSDAQAEPQHAGGHVVDRVLADRGDRGRVVDQRLGAALIQRAEIDLEVDRTVVAVQVQRAQRRDVHLGAAVQGRP